MPWTRAGRSQQGTGGFPDQPPSPPLPSGGWRGRGSNWERDEGERVRNFYKIYGVIWVSFMTSFFNTVNRPLSEAALPEVGAGAAGAPGSTRAPGAGPRPRRLGKQTWRCLASLHQKSIFFNETCF